MATIILLSYKSLDCRTVEDGGITDLQHSMYLCVLIPVAMHTSCDTRIGCSVKAVQAL